MDDLLVEVKLDSKKNRDNRDSKELILALHVTALARLPAAVVVVVPFI